MSKMSLTRRNEVIRVKLCLSSPIDLSRSLTTYVSRECPACMILTRLKSALQEPCMAPDETSKTGARKLGRSNFVCFQKSREQPQALAVPTFNQTTEAISTPYAHGGGHYLLFPTQI